MLRRRGSRRPLWFASRRSDQKQRQLELRRRALETQIEDLRAQFQAEEEGLNRAIAQGQAREDQLVERRKEMARARKVNVPKSNGGGRAKGGRR